ncbi:hypothetical protein EMIHUDRAFT_351344, partial [Emiliania huxleyi CCMP1516]|uniref:Uncharacterized protein n=2 Tax=Emiliania huxleyi TaxID=2903 RepID=A0A0D3L045_EMIH1
PASTGAPRPPPLPPAHPRPSVAPALMRGGRGHRPPGWAQSSAECDCSWPQRPSTSRFTCRPRPLRLAMPPPSRLFSGRGSRRPCLEVEAV